MDEIVKRENIVSTVKHSEVSLENRLEIIDEGIRKKYLSRLEEMEIMPFEGFLPIEEDIINNIRLYKVSEMVYQKGESVVDKFTTVFNTLSTYNSSVFVVIDSDGQNTNFYLGVRNNEPEDSIYKRSTVTLGDTLKNTLIGHFPGIKIKNKNRQQIEKLSQKIVHQQNVASVSVVANNKGQKEQQNNEQFVQGLEKLALAMQGKQYTGILIAKNRSSQEIQLVRKGYQDLYTSLSPLQKLQITDSQSESNGKNQSFFEMDGKQKAAMIGGAVATIAGVGVGAAIGQGAGAILGGQIVSPISNLINSLAPNEQISTSISISTSTTSENKAVTDMLKLIDESLTRTNDFDSYGMWNVAGYFVSNDMSSAEIAASNYRSLMNGENSGREVSAINSWRKNNPELLGNFEDLTSYLSRFTHPLFNYGGGILIDAGTSVSGKELGLHLGLPRATVSGLPVIEHAEFGKEVQAYQLFSKDAENTPENRMTLGRVFDLGKITNRIVELDNRSLSMHTFITGSTGSGKSNTVYQILSELRQDRIPFLVIEPAKGEYKDVFGHLDDVHVFSTNPTIAPLIQLNPFKFPSSIHVLEHVDGLVEIFSACWPMYDAMPAFLKNAILKAYETLGWDLTMSIFEGDEIEYPDFELLAEQLEKLINETDYSAEIKGNYTGALTTRVKSLTVGLNRFIFTSEQTPYHQLFDENCILDISRVKSNETKALIMGLMIYILNEYRVDTKINSNNGLKHITVLEEAHNLLKNTNSNGVSELVGKSIEMLTNTIAEVRTYGEGFVIVDQSPSSVDISAIKNTNTKIVLRTPEANDREAVGRSIGLTIDQVNEIAKLPSGVAVVYQNDWINPVLTLIDKATVDEIPYTYTNPKMFKPLREARTDIIKAIMQPWIQSIKVSERELEASLEVVKVSKEAKKLLLMMLEIYSAHDGKIIWDVNSLNLLQVLLKDILELESVPEMYSESDMNNFRNKITMRTSGLHSEQIEEICAMLTREVE